MRIVYSENHRLHFPQGEIYGGELVTPFERPSRVEYILRSLKEAGLKGIRVEGQGTADWVLIDAGDVILHIFRPEVRAFYNLEKMWSADRPVERVMG